MLMPQGELKFLLIKKKTLLKMLKSALTPQCWEQTSCTLEFAACWESSGCQARLVLVFSPSGSSHWQA